MPEIKLNAQGEELQLTGKLNGHWAMGRELFGRAQIFTDAPEITGENVIDVLNAALPYHLKNRREIEYLYNYLRGDQPVRQRVKKVNEDICNRIVINRANEIVTFKTANFIGEPLQYVSRGSLKSVPKKIERLNDFMMSENKASKDMELAYWMFTAGVGYRLALRDKAEAFSFMKAAGETFDEAPFEIYTLDPRNTFIVRKNDVTKGVAMAVTYVYTHDGNALYTVYTHNSTYYIQGTKHRAEKKKRKITHNFGQIPIVEYPCNSLRMGAFEIVIDLLDAMNLTESDRLDGVEQFIQALMVLENVDISREEFLELKDLGAIKLPSVEGQPSKLYYLNEQLNQSETQTLMDDMYQTVLSIVGMPSQGNANTSDSSNNGAVIMKNGWWNAEARAKETESMWKQSETDFLKIILKICQDSGAVDLKISQIEQKFGRRSYEDKLTKVQAFTSLIASGAPSIQAFTVSGLVVDPESASILYDRYQKEKEEELEKSLERAKPTEIIETVSEAEPGGIDE